MDYTFTPSQRIVETAYNGKSEIQSLQVLKLFCAFLVIVRHSTNPLRECYFTEIISQIGVLIFAMITGYFLLNSNGELKLSRLKYTAIKIAKIYIVAQLFYFAIWAEMTYKYAPHIITEFFTCPKEIILAIIYGDKFFCGIWYLSSMVEAIGVLALLVKFNKLKWLPYLCLIGFIGKMALGPYRFMWTEIKFEPWQYCNFLTVIVMCLYAGMFIRLNEDKIKASIKSLSLCAIVVYGLLVLERLIIKSAGYEFEFFTMPFAIVTFMLALKINKIPHTELLAKLGREHSMNIFLWHYFIQLILWKMNVYERYEANPLVVFLLAIPLSMIINKLKSLVTRKRMT
jgi:peptidoglycan/LPS O-acetylase OafA/YrhL